MNQGEEKVQNALLFITVIISPGIFGWRCGKMYQYRSIFHRWGTVWYQ
mgnify:CR=1 FL=1